MSVFAEHDESSRDSVPVGSGRGGHEGGESEGDKLEMHCDCCLGCCLVEW
jgi:hypothetical protein